MTRFRRATNDTFRSLGVRNFRLFFGGQLVSQIGNWLTLVAQTLLVLKLTDSGVALGLLAAAQFGPVLVLGPFAGTGRRPVRQAQAPAGGAGRWPWASRSAWPPSPSPALPRWRPSTRWPSSAGLTVAFDNPARRSYVVDLVAEDDIGNAVSLNSALMTGSRVVGPALAGLLITTVGFGWAFLLDGLSYVAVLAGLWLIDPTQVRAAPVTPRGKGQVREGLRYARSVPELWIPLVMMAVIGTLAFNFQTVLPLFVTRDLGGSTVTFTLLMSVVSAGSLVGALATARRRRIDIRMVGVAAVAFGVAIGCLAVAPNQPVAFAVGLVMGVSSIAFMTASTAIVQLTAAPSMRGRVLALQSMLFLGSTPIGGPIVGFISQHFGARYSLALGAVGTVAAGVFGLLSVRRHARPVEVVEPLPLAVATEPGDLDPLVTSRAS